MDETQEELKELLTGGKEDPQTQDLEYEREHLGISSFTRAVTKFKKELYLRIMNDLGVKTELISCLPLEQIERALEKHLENCGKNITVKVEDEDELLEAMRARVRYQLDVRGEGREGG